MAKNSDEHIRVGTVKTVPVNSLRQHPENVRLHGDRNIDDIKASLREFGQRRPLLVAKDGTTVVAGNGTLQAANSLGWETVSVQVTDLEGDTALAYAIADNRTAETSEWDDEALADQLKRFVEDGKQHLAEASGWNSDELAARFNVFPGGQPSEPEEAPEPQIDRAEELREKWGVESGQIWEIEGQAGTHRLMCGDSTNAESVALLLDGNEPFIMVTDPPYGVEYDANWRNEADRANGKPYGASAVGKVTNDDRADWQESYKLFPGHVAYVWHPAGATQFVFFETITAAGFEIRMQMIWAKQQFPIGRGHYHVQHEPCYYCVRPNPGGGGAKWNGSRKETTLWQIDKPVKSDTGHSTQKPTECMARPIRNHGQEGDGVYEPFSGSGTTLVASEQLSRVCYAMELHPPYVAVALQRLADMGLEPIRAHEKAPTEAGA